jgi:putative ABC transport system permease protein
LSVRKAAADVDPAFIVAPKTLRSVLDEAGSRLGTMIHLISGLAILATLLAAAGLYGVVDFTMSRRTREFGIRMALGAPRAAILKSALSSGTRPVVMGLITGTLGAALGAQILARVLRNTPVALNPADATVYITVAALLGVTAFAAMLRPVWRAAAADPVKALRDE